MILSDTAILAAIDCGDIVVEPFDRDRLGTNSYDVGLGKNLACYIDEVLDARVHNHVERFEIAPEGIVLEPGKTYLGVTEEYTETRRYVPFLEGKSSVGRLGIDIHATAGKGDVGFCNHWEPTHPPTVDFEGGWVGETKTKHFCRTVRRNASQKVR